MVRHALWLVAILGCGGHGHQPDVDAPGDAPPPLPTITWSSSHRVEQVIGDIDWASCTPATMASCTATKSKTLTNANVLGNGLGYSFEYVDPATSRQELVFLFGDTIATGTWDGTTLGDPALNYHGKDPFAWSTTADPEQPLELAFFLDPAAPGQPLFIVPTDANGTKLPFAGDDIPNSGIAIDGQMDIVYSTNSDASCTPPCDPHADDYSVLTYYDTQTMPASFPLGRRVSTLASSHGGHFIIDALHTGELDGQPVVFTFGIGDPKNSLQLPDAPANIYLAVDPTGAFWAGGQTRYLTGVAADGTPAWSAPGTPEPAVLDPIVVDNPNDDSPPPPPSASNLSVVRSADLGLWLMTFDGGKYTAAGYPTDGIYFTYAPEPWGPWAKPQLVYNACRDGGFGTFIHYNASASVCPNVAADSGPAGPMIGNNDPSTQRGGAFAPQLIERYVRASGDALTIYYTMSTWNPYTVVKMRSDFTVRRN